RVVLWILVTRVSAVRDRRIRLNVSQCSSEAVTAANVFTATWIVLVFERCPGPVRNYFRNHMHRNQRILLAVTRSVHVIEPSRIRRAAGITGNPAFSGIAWAPHWKPVRFNLNSVCRKGKQLMVGQVRGEEILQPRYLLQVIIHYK